MTKSVTPLDFIKTLPIHRENLTHPLTLLFGVAIAGLAIGTVLLYRRWSVLPTSFVLAKKAYAKQKYQETLEHCNKAINLKVGPFFDIEILRAKAYIGLKNYNEALKHCNMALGLKAGSSSEIQLLRAKAYIGLKNYEEAKKACLDAADAVFKQKENAALVADLHLQRGKASAGLGDWGDAVSEYDQSLHALSDPFNLHSFHRLKFEALIRKAQALRKCYQHCETSIGKAEALKKPYQHSALNALSLAYANLDTLRLSGIAHEEYRELFVQFYYTRIYYFLDLGAHMPAWYDCGLTLRFLDELPEEPSNDQETEIFVLYSLLFAKQGEKSQAFSRATEGLQIDARTSVNDAEAHLSTKITNKKILAATYFICALCSTESSAALKYYEEAFKNAENDDLKVAILFKRGNLYLTLGNASTGENAKFLFRHALEDFEKAEELARQKVVPQSDLSKSLLHLLELNDLQEKIAAIYKDQNIAAAKADLQSQSTQSKSSK